MVSLSHDRLVEILTNITQLQIGVIGDFALDGYWVADMTRSELSRETPLYNHPVIEERYTPGGGANVAWNLVDLGVRDVHSFTVIGNDWRGEILMDILSKIGINCESILIEDCWKSPFFGKIILSGYQNRQEDSRIDFINPVSISEEISRTLLERLETKMVELDALLIADYLSPGIISIGSVIHLQNLANNYPECLVIADSRLRTKLFQNCIIKPNRVEACKLFFPEAEMSDVLLEDLIRAGLTYKKGSGKPVFITIGEDGCIVFDALGPVLIPAVSVPHPIDSVGAGDTFLAVLSSSLAGGATPVEAAAIGNLAASVTVRKIGITGTASPEEIIEAYNSSYST